MDRLPQVTDVLPVLPGLGRVPTHHPGYVHRTGGLSHTQQDNGPPSLGPRRHADFAGYTRKRSGRYPCRSKHRSLLSLSLIHISEPTRLLSISYAVFCLKKKKKKNNTTKKNY